MVHFEDAEITFLAVVGSERFPSLFAILALLTILHFKQLALKVCFQTLWDASWVREACLQMTDSCHDAKSIEDNEVNEPRLVKRNSLHEHTVDEVGFVPVEDASAITNILTIPDQRQYKMGEEHAPIVFCPVHYSFLF